MVRAALSVRKDLIDKGRDPSAGKFFCSEHEKLTILDQPPFMVLPLNVERDRIAGLKIEVIEDGPPDNSRDQHG